MTEPLPTKIEMSRAAEAALRAGSGNLYVWADSGGLPVARMSPPDRSIDFDRFSGNGWIVHVDRTIQPPSRWVIKRSRLPLPHFVALYDPPSTRLEKPSLGDAIQAFFSDLPF